MGRERWLLELIGSGLDPIRIQKGMFLFAMESGAPASDRYAFEPYNWGPFSQPIYAALERLQENGLVERVPVPGGAYFSYRRTAAGDEEARKHVEQADAQLVEKVTAIRQFVTSLGFQALLKRIYEKYPDYASKSLFQH